MPDDGGEMDYEKANGILGSCKQKRSAIGLYLSLVRRKGEDECIALAYRPNNSIDVDLIKYYPNKQFNICLDVYTDYYMSAVTKHLPDKWSIHRIETTNMVNDVVLALAYNRDGKLVTYPCNRDLMLYEDDDRNTKEKRYDISPSELANRVEYTARKAVETFFSGKLERPEPHKTSPNQIARMAIENQLHLNDIIQMASYVLSPADRTRLQLYWRQNYCLTTKRKTDGDMAREVEVLMKNPELRELEPWDKRTSTFRYIKNAMIVSAEVLIFRSMGFERYPIGCTWKERQLYL